MLAALLARQKGQRVGSLETALVETAFSVIPCQASAARLSGKRPPKAGKWQPSASGQAFDTVNPAIAQHSSQEL